MRKIFDLFCYNGEKIIDLRLNLLKDKVDYLISGAEVATEKVKKKRGRKPKIKVEDSN